jgi:hypothetical protein
MVIFDPLRKFWQKGSVVTSAVNTNKFLESVKNKLNRAFVSKDVEKSFVNLDISFQQKLVEVLPEENPSEHH